MNGEILKGMDILERLKRSSNWISEYFTIKHACKEVEKLQINLRGLMVNVQESLAKIFKTDKWNVWTSNGLQIRSPISFMAN